jgi:hypothetical protein
MHIHIAALRSAVLCAGLSAAACCVAGGAGPPPSAAPRWEVTVGASGKHNGKGWKFALPESEIKYQWSERLQLLAENSWVIVRPDGGPATSGLGTAKLGFKWLFWDEQDFSMALGPQLARFISRSSVRRGLISADKEYALATETKLKAAGLEFEIKAGRNFIEGAADEWMVEIKAGRPCLPNADCILIVERNFVPADLQRTLVKAGIDWKMHPTLTLKSAWGREIGPSGAERKDLAVNIGLQFVF